MTNKVYHKVGKMDLDAFAPSLELDQTNLEELIRNYIFGGFKAIDNKIRFELHELNVYGTHLINMRVSNLAETQTKFLPSQGFFH